MTEATGAVTAPVAVSQESMVWHEQLTPGSFNLPCLVRRYDGPLDVAALRWALHELARRHEPLRTTFEIDGGVARQVVAADGPGLAEVDLGPLAPAEREAETARLLADATNRPFDLAAGPLFQPRLLRLGPHEHLLVVRLHHTVFDDWSVDVFRRQLSALYGAARAGAPSPLPAPAIGFSGYARRQRDRLSGDGGASHLAWWRDELAGGPLAVQLPIGRPEDGTAAPAEPGGPVRVELPAPLAAGVRALAPRLRATPYMTVLAAFSVLVARDTGQDDLVLGTVVAHRDSSDVEGLIGCFTKKVPLRLRLGGDPSFAELVARTRASLLGALAHQDVAFDAAVREGLGAAAAAHGVVPQVALVFQGEAPRREQLALPGVVARPYRPPAESRRERHFSTGPAKPGGHDRRSEWGDGVYLGTFLLASLVEGPDGMAVVARGAFDRRAGRRLLERFADLLAEVVDGPDRPVSALAAILDADPGDGDHGPRPGGDLAGPGVRRPVAGAGEGTGPAAADHGPRPGGDLAGPGVRRPVAGAGEGADWLLLRGFRAGRSRLEAALARCPGVADVALAVRDGEGGDPCLVAYVVAGRRPAPTLAELRHALWTSLPGALWPAAAVVVEAIPRRPGGAPDVDRLPAPGPSAEDPLPAEVDLLAARWAAVRGGPVSPDRSYWQDFSFLPALADARRAGLAVTDEQVARNRTLRTLAADVAAARARAASPA